MKVRAEIAIVSPQAMLDDQAQGFLPDDIHIEMGDDPNVTVITGEREAVFRFLTDDLSVDADEANEYIERELDDDENPMGDHTCPECGAGPGEECECSVDDEDPRDFNDARLDAKRVGEGVIGFDKYMDQILIKEGHGRPAVKPEDNPQRRRAALHQDRPNNKIRYGVK